ncbi:MAG: HAD family phosphatase [Gemmataceae bacterium]
MVRAAIWDMDGTLVDTAEMHFEAWRRVCEELGRPFTRAYFAATFGRRNPEILQYLFPDRFGADEMARLGEHKEELYRAAAGTLGVELLPGVRELLVQLQAAGFRQAIGSSAPRANLEMILDQTGIRDLLGAVVAAEDTSRGKPDPQVFLLGAEKLDVLPSHCVVFEDAPAGIQAARAGGMKAIGVSFVGHHSADTLVQSGAHRVVHSLTEIDVPAIVQLIG